MNDALALSLTVAFWLLVVFLAFWLLLGLLAIYVTVKIRKRVKIIERAVNHAMYNNDSLVRLDGVWVNQDEAEQIKAYVRAHKEREARDLDTIDKATEFRRDI